MNLLKAFVCLTLSKFASTQSQASHCKTQLKNKQIATDITAAITYVPRHPDADSFGYAQFPNIDLDEEVSTMVELQHDYESIAASCK